MCVRVCAWHQPLSCPTRPSPDEAGHPCALLLFLLAPGDHPPLFLLPSPSHSPPDSMQDKMQV